MIWVIVGIISMVFAYALGYWHAQQNCEEFWMREITRERAEMRLNAYGHNKE